MNGRKSPLLVVDDDFDSRELLARRFRRAGYEVATAAGGREAIDQIQSTDIDLVLLDSMMPEMSGPEVLRLLRATYSQADLPVVMVTALNESQRIVEALAAGANDYVTKPVDFPVVLARVEAQLKRKWAEAALRDSEERFSLAARGANDGLWDWDLVSGRIYFSPRWKEMLGYADTEVANELPEWIDRVHGADRPQLIARILAVREGRGEAEFHAEYRILHRSGEYRWMLSRGGVLAGENGERVRMAGSQTDITKNKATDALTGLANRVRFGEKLAYAMEEAHRSERGMFAVLFLDLDRFKNVNDSLGHLAGDQLLIEVARRLERVVRSGADGGGRDDLVARFGGDEFAVLLRGVADADEARAVAERLLREFRAPVSVEGHSLQINASIGIALWHPAYHTAAEMLRDADTAMYRAKAAGRAQCAVFDNAMRVEAIQRLEIEATMHRALENGEFEVFYQPKVRLESGAVEGFEALLRWRHPLRGLMLPDEFIGVAEDTGLILPIGEWVIRQACVTLRRWQAEIPDLPPLEMSVNLSTRQFRQPDLVEMVAGILAETGLPPGCLKLEITESVLADDPVAAAETMRRLMEHHVGLKIDDFGTGYSSLNYLTRLPCDALKIDRSFVTGLASDDSSQEVVRAILAMASNLKLEVIAEGVESGEQSAKLRELGCELGQGFLYSRPVPEADAREILRRGRCP